ncbi:hypothetical protein PLANPX_2432 [Lacipirellula parvula]|uniref:Uncharacterized protein n=1 Tax=Lacipirellula parvula TaxID=2650471 RepID=A0A5K7X869_9BACT|nr:hypothetical protein PLANPX_2432 [Lacipirellula parvula]
MATSPSLDAFRDSTRSVRKGVEFFQQFAKPITEAHEQQAGLRFKPKWIGAAAAQEELAAARRFEGLLN